MSLKRRLEIIEKYCDLEHSKEYYELKKCRDKAINMSYREYMNGEKQHDYSNLWSCVYDFKKTYNVEETMEEIMQLMNDICFSIDREHQVHNFKVENRINI